MDGDFDLFGLPDDPGRNMPGRPRKIATVEDRSKVNVLLALGWDLERIAATVGMSLPTFRRNFFHELKQRQLARDRLKARVLMATMSCAVQGNVQAQKLMLAAIEKQDLADASEAYGAQTVEGRAKALPKPVALGKKQAKLMAAQLAQENELWGEDLKFEGGIGMAH